MEREHYSATPRARRAQDIPARAERPKRTGRRPRRILGLWTRVALLLMAIGVLGLAIFGLITKAIRPYREARAQTGQMNVTRGQIAALDRQNATLRRRIAYVATDEGKITEARKMGYVKPGEIPIVVEGSAPASSNLTYTPPSSPVRPHSQGGSKVRPLWRRFTGH